MKKDEPNTLKIWFRISLGLFAMGYLSFALHAYVPIHLKKSQLADNVAFFFALSTPILVILIAIMDFMLHKENRSLLVNKIGAIVIFILSVYFNFLFVVGIALDSPYRVSIYKHKFDNQEILLLNRWYDEPFEVMKSYDYRWFTYEVPFDTLLMNKQEWNTVKPPESK